MDNKVKKYLEETTKSIKENYKTETIKNLEDIAIKEYGIKGIVETKYFNCPRIIKKKNEYAIFYYGLTENSKKAEIAHELGHKIAGHFEDRKISNFKKEIEADYFARNLLNINWLGLQYFRILNVLSKMFPSFSFLFPDITEKQKIIDAGLKEFL